jgi:hypothetical protein
MKIALKLGLAWPDIKDLYDVSFNGIRIGRVWFARDRSPAQQPWEWLVSLPMALPDSTKGTAGTLNDALNAFAAAWAQLLSTTQPARLQRALDLAQVVDHKDQPANSARTSQQNSLERTLELAALGADVVRDAKTSEQPKRSGAVAPATAAATMPGSSAATTGPPPTATGAAAAGNQRPPALPQRTEDAQKPPRKPGRISVNAAKVLAPVVALNTRPEASQSPPAPRSAATSVVATTGPIRPALHPVRTGPPTPPAPVASQVARRAPAQNAGATPPGGAPAGPGA